MADYDLVVLHFHLNRGGVTRVVENHLRSLAEQPPEARPRRVVVAYGGRKADWDETLSSQLPFPVAMHAVPALEYDRLAPQTAGKFLSKTNAMLQSERLEPASTILHFHNHSLGKRVDVPAAICQLAESGWRLLLQIHDFAEDLRPANYRSLSAVYGELAELQADLYPRAPNLRYAMLNGRDREVMLSSGIPESELHLIPNPVVASFRPPGTEEVAALRERLESKYQVPSDHRYVVYPVRGIRRKNLGELLLWAALSEKTTFAITLAPLNPDELAAYDAWRELAAELKLPVLFNVSEEFSLEESYAVADAIITTSVTEGFGLVYLEASMADRPLFGRDLPGITVDFRENGLRFPGLAPQLLIPEPAVDVDALTERYTGWLLGLLGEFGLESEGSTQVKRRVADSFTGDSIDFGRLDSEQQQLIVRRVCSEAELRQAVRTLNPVLSIVGDQPQLATGANRRIIDERYSPAVIGRQLGDIYRQLLECTPGDVQRSSAIARRVLESFIQPGHLIAIRLET